jgi:hypothetical protein
MFECFPTPLLQRTFGVQSRGFFEKTEVKNLNLEWVRPLIIFPAIFKLIVDGIGNGNTVKSVRPDVKPKPIHIPKPPNHTQHEAPSQPPSEPVLAEVAAEPQKARLNGPPPTSTPAEPQLTSAEAQGVEKMDTAVTANIDIAMNDSERLVAESAKATTAGVQYVNDMATDAGESSQPLIRCLPNTP